MIDRNVSDVNEIGKDMIIGIAWSVYRLPSAFFEMQQITAKFILMPRTARFGFPEWLQGNQRKERSGVLKCSSYNAAMFRKSSIFLSRKRKKKRMWHFPRSILVHTIYRNSLILYYYERDKGYDKPWESLSQILRR